MSTPADGPASVPKLILYQKVALDLTVVIPDPDGVLAGASATWFAGRRPGAADLQSMGLSGAATAKKSGLSVTSSGGVAEVAFTIEPDDFGALAPGNDYQHEVWVQPDGGESKPYAIGWLEVVGTVGGST